MRAEPEQGTGAKLVQLGSVSVVPPMRPLTPMLLEDQALQWASCEAGSPWGVVLVQTEEEPTFWAASSVSMGRRRGPLVREVQSWARVAPFVRTKGRGEACGRRKREEGPWEASESQAM
jgi:hypothetical protein